MPTTPPLVLVVDDTEDSRAAMASHLKHQGCNVIEAVSFESAVDKLITNTQLNLLVTDLNLTTDTNDRSGVSFAKISKQLRQDMPVAGYSQKVETNKFTIGSNSVFDIFLDTSTANSEDYISFSKECAKQANQHINLATPHLRKIRADIQIKEMKERIKDLEEMISQKQEKFVTQDKLFVTVAGAIAIVVTVLSVISFII